MKTFYKTILLLFLNISFLVFNSFSQQAPGIEWAKCYGGDLSDGATSIVQTLDGGYIVSGNTWSTNGDVTGNHGTIDYWILKLDTVGNIVWKKCLGGSFGEYAYSVQQTFDGGYIVGGYTTSNNGNVSGNHGGNSGYADYWIVKLNSNGNIQWKKCYGGTSHERDCKVIQTPDSGYIMSGTTDSNDGQVTGYHGSGDIWVVKVNSNGVLQWQKCYGGSSSEYGFDIALTNDNGYIVAGRTWSNDGDVSGNHDTLGNRSDCWIAKIDSVGNLEWQKCLGGTEYDEAWSVQQTFDSGYIISGLTASYNGDVSGLHGHDDYWIVKLDNNGTIQWQKCLGGSCYETAYCVRQTLDSGFVIAGYICSIDGDVIGSHDSVALQTNGEAWIVKLSSNGNLIWQKCLGGTKKEGARSLYLTMDGGYAVAGWTNSHDGDIVGNNDTTYHGNYWIVKLLPDTITGISNLQISNANFQMFPNPSNGIFQIIFPSSNQKTNYTLEVINTLGQTVFTSDLRLPASDLQTKLDLSFLSQGMYVLKINDGSNTGNKILIIN
jgi:hypothetical protein